MQGEIAREAPRGRKGAFAAGKALALEAQLSDLDKRVIEHLRNPNPSIPATLVEEQVFPCLSGI